MTRVSTCPAVQPSCTAHIHTRARAEYNHLCEMLSSSSLMQRQLNALLVFHVYPYREYILITYNKKFRSFLRDIYDQFYVPNCVILMIIF
jgi:hypothetical protein